MVERKTGVAREICHPHKYTSVHVYDSERRREEEKERERRRGCDLGGIKKKQLKTQHTFEEKK